MSEKVHNLLAGRHPASPKSRPLASSRVPTARRPRQSAFLLLVGAKDSTPAVSRREELDPASSLRSIAGRSSSSVGPARRHIPICVLSHGAEVARIPRAPRLRRDPAPRAHARPPSDRRDACPSSNEFPPTLPPRRPCRHGRSPSSRADSARLPGWSPPRYSERRSTSLAQLPGRRDRPDDRRGYPSRRQSLHPDGLRPARVNDHSSYSVDRSLLPSTAAATWLRTQASASLPRNLGHSGSSF